MLLALDVGNTNVTVGVFAGPRIVARTRVESSAALRPGVLERRLKGFGKVEAVIYGSVVPALDRRLERAVKDIFGCRAVRVGPQSRLGIRLRVDKPRQVGADRLLNALAAHRLARGAAVVVDFGTATTFDCVARSGDYLGGAILPGPRMAARALAEGTAKLPLVAVRRPRRVVGKNTEECIAAGVYYGYLGMIEKILALTLRELAPAKPKLIATGGLAALFARDLPKGMTQEPDLTLQGLRAAYDILSGKEC